METIGCFITQIGFITQNIALNRISVLFHEIDRLLWGSFFLIGTGAGSHVLTY